MKELSIEQKAKRYDEAIERAKGMHEQGMMSERLEYVFPELKESEDEKIRKEIMSYIKSSGAITNKQWIAWLEKQGEQKPADKVEPKFKVGDMISNGTSEVKIVEVNNNSYGVTNDEIENDCNPSNWVVYFKDQDNWKLFEQKSTDKVEPKFKEGDWVIYENRVGIIVRILKEHYIISFDGVEEQVSFTFNDRITKWTIQDAKDGDVLVADNGLAFIYNGYLEEQQWPFAYGGINIYGRFNICDGLLPFTHQKVVPATKEQCDALIKAMTNAGYECDAEKKELRKIEQKPVSNQFTPEQANVLDKHIDKFLEQKKSAWSEEDEKMKDAIYSCVDSHYDGLAKTSLLIWLKSIKDRVQPKQGWSEEDEYYRNIILYCLNNESVGKADKENAIKWFKSLRPQNTWKPSEEQLKALKEIIDVGHFTSYPNALETLYEQLKKLK